MHSAQPVSLVSMNGFLSNFKSYFTNSDKQKNTIRYVQEKQPKTSRQHHPSLCLLTPTITSRHNIIWKYVKGVKREMEFCTMYAVPSKEESSANPTMVGRTFVCQPYHVFRAVCTKTQLSIAVLQYYQINTIIIKLYYGP